MNLIKKMDNSKHSYLSSVGCVFPQDEYEMGLFEKQNENIDFELNETDLDPYSILKELKEEIPKRSRSNNFFQRSVLAAKITHDCYHENTFGRVKFQKMVYLCEHVSKMNFTTRYTKQAAGPMDNRFIHSVKPHFESQKWFSIEKVKSGNYEKVQFRPLENVDGYKKYYDKYYSEVDHEINHLINTFKLWKTNDVELVATIFACWDEFNSKDQEFTEEEMIKKIYKWNKSKKKFSEQQIKAAINWMRESNIYPV